MLLLQVETKRKRVSIDEIEAKLKEAALRRQQFHAWVASKAKSRRMTSAAALRKSTDAKSGPDVVAPVSDAADCAVTASVGSPPEVMLQRLCSRLEAARKKREEMEQQHRRRQEKTSAQRQQAVNEARQRQEAKLAEMESLREEREEKAESNRAAILEAERQKRAVVRKRAAKLRARRAEQEWRDHQRALKRLEALGDRLKAAEQKRRVRLEAERERAAALSSQARQVAETVWKEREKELEKRRERLEAKVAEARCRRAELMSARGGCTGSCHLHGHRKRLQWETLSRKLSKCWRTFRGTKKTSIQLARALVECGISRDTLQGETFESLAGRISSPTTLSAAKELLQRLLLRLSVISDDEVTAWRQHARVREARDVFGRMEGQAGHKVGSQLMLPKSNVAHLLSQLLPRTKRATGRQQPARLVQRPVQRSGNATATAPKSPGVALGGGACATSGNRGDRVLPPALKASLGEAGGSALADSKHLHEDATRTSARHASSLGEAHKPTSSASQLSNLTLDRYPVRPFLSSYMVVLHPDAVMTSTSGETGLAVRDAAARLVAAFEAVVSRLLGEGIDLGTLQGQAKGKNQPADRGKAREGKMPQSGGVQAAHFSAGAEPKSTRPLERAAVRRSLEFGGEATPVQQGGVKVISLKWLLLNFDQAWVEFLHLFVAWKLEDERQLESDLIGAACRLEASMLRRCGSKGMNELSHDLQAIREQVTADLRLLRGRIQRLTGIAGVERLDAALHEVRLQGSGSGTSNSSSCCGSGLSSTDTSSGGSAPQSPASSTSNSPRQSPSVSPCRGGPRGRANGTPRQQWQTVTPLLLPLPSQPLPVPTQCGAQHSTPGDGTPCLMGPASADATAGPLQPQAGAVRVLSNPCEGTKGVISTGSQVPQQEDDRSFPSEGQVKSLDSLVLPDKVALIFQRRIYQSLDASQLFAGQGTSLLDATSSPVEVAVSTAMKAAFWRLVQDSLLATPPDTSLVEELLVEFHQEVGKLVPMARAGLVEQLGLSQTQALRALNLLAGELSSEEGVQNIDGVQGSEQMAVIHGELSALLEGASRLMLELGSEARESTTEAALAALKQQLNQDTSNGSRVSLAGAFTGGLAFLFEQLMVLKQDVAVAPLLLLPIPATIHMLQASLAAAHGLSSYPPPSSEVLQKLPRTVSWLQSARRRLFGTEPGSNPAQESQAALDQSALGVISLRSGRDVAEKPGTSRWKTLPWLDVAVIRLGILNLVACPSGVQPDEVPEVLLLDLHYLRGCQESFQRIVVAATGLLLIKQGLASSLIPLSAALDSALESNLPKLEAALAREDINASTLAEHLTDVAMASASACGHVQLDCNRLKSIFTPLLHKALDPAGTIFVRVSSAVVNALKLLLVPSATVEKMEEHVLPDVQSQLKKGGAGPLLSETIQLSKRIRVICEVSTQIHGELYVQLVQAIELKV